MKLIQASWSEVGALLLWGEGLDVKSPGEDKPGRKLNYSQAQPLAHALPLQTLQVFMLLVEQHAAEAQLAQLWLPSQSGRPLASPRIRALSEPAVDYEADTDSVQLDAWTVPALVLNPLTALDLLSALPGLPTPGFKLDDSVKYWIELTKLLLDLLSRGRFLPGIAHQDGGFAARWLVVCEDEKERLDVFSRTMPGACRAFAASSSLPESQQVVRSFLMVCGDALIRSFLSSRDLTPRIIRPGHHSLRTAAAAWLRGLTHSCGVITNPAVEFSALEAQLAAWTGTLIAPVKPPALKVGFRLVSPDDDTGKWVIELSLNETAAETHQLPAALLWRGNLRALQTTGYNIEELEELLLAELSRATESFPQLRSALNQPFPARVELTALEAYQFLKEQAPDLVQAGFRVLYPEWWKIPSAKASLQLNVESPDDDQSRSGFVGLGELLDFSWQVSLGDEQLSPDDFRELVKRNLPLVKLNNHWIELAPHQVNATLDFLGQHEKKRRISLLTALRLAFGADASATALPVAGIKASGWVRKLLDNRREEVIQISQPAGFIGTLRPYQVAGLSWLSYLDRLGIGCCLADDMGLGKTIQLLSLLLYEREQAQVAAENLKPTLLICPLSILDNWRREAARFAPSLSTLVYHGADRPDGESFVEAARGVDLVITTYNLAHRAETLLAELEWGRIALDEAQNIKNIHAKQTAAIRRLARKQAFRENKRGATRVALTGTPLENHLEELWSIFDFLNPGYFGALNDFRQRFAVPIERFRNKQASERLRQLVTPFILRRLKTDARIISDLPEKIEMDIFTPLTKEQAAFYQTVLDGMLPQVERSMGMHRKGLVLSMITRLKQICDHPALYLNEQEPVEGRSGKLEALEELLEVILAEGDKTLIFTQFAQMGHLLRRRLQERFDCEVLFLHGGQTSSARSKLVDRFQSTDGPKLFVLSLKAGGFGLNLTEASQVVHYDQWWNPAVQDQATDRAHRIGQKRNVQVRRFICKGTLEERIAEMLTEKRELARSIVGSTKSTLTEMSPQALWDLLKLTE